ncbi:MAG: ASCH domain-containing protein [Arthrobacter sp.]|nr:ASCH domain-containing protein [Micrococcaceae bacterium]MDN5811887.1 ASCH domain-containing protein [Micrococcaceae bacterium]MDN5878551.1 ASCH domain-containing protein [Micrococcaceae bacterium]MDN5886392.1 ASCH domain-containing protein [Micrococcaceae bacterium]MDN5904484.1 ASCH domain-containing protein [Micrococcaceae bacterium]
MNDDLPIIEFAFPGPLRDSLIAAIESGAKTSTSSLMREYEVGDGTLPVVGDAGCVVGSDGERLFAVETTGVDFVRLADVPLDHALAEGEGHTSVAEWRADHLEFWTSAEIRAELGADFEPDDDTMVVLERFAVVR